MPTLKDLIAEPYATRQARYIIMGSPGYEVATTTSTMYRAETVSITGRHVAPGRTVVIVADTVTCQDAIIDVSCATGVPSFPPGTKAVAGSFPSGDGGDADASHLGRGGAGQDAGNISIFCRMLTGTLSLLANGGKGGNGLNGGDGAKGATGQAGNPSTDFHQPEPANGRQGSRGGRAGNGGVAGSGGNGGTITIKATINTAHLVTSAAAGTPGDPGQPGKPGAGGGGGAPGAYGEWVENVPGGHDRGPGSGGHGT